MSEALNELLERATKRPWRTSRFGDGSSGDLINVVSEPDEMMILQDIDREDANLIAIAVNHFEEAIRTLRHIVHTKHFRENIESGEAFAEVSRLAYDAAVKLLAKIEAAAKETP